MLFIVLNVRFVVRMLLKPCITATFSNQSSGLIESVPFSIPGPHDILDADLTNIERAKEQTNANAIATQMTIGRGFVSSLQGCRIARVISTTASGRLKWGYDDPRSCRFAKDHRFRELQCGPDLERWRSIVCTLG